jgi:hypothetical protein
VLRDLRKQSVQSPSATIGILDVLESIAPDPSTGNDVKAIALETALRESTKAESQSALHLLYLIDARLRRVAFSDSSSAFNEQLKTAVARLVAKEPMTLFDRLQNSLPSDPSPYLDGVIEGLASIAAKSDPVLF